MPVGETPAPASPPHVSALSQRAQAGPPSPPRPAGQELERQRSSRQPCSCALTGGGGGEGGGPSTEL